MPSRGRNTRWITMVEPNGAFDAVHHRENMSPRAQTASGLHGGRFPRSPFPTLGHTDQAAGASPPAPLQRVAGLWRFSGRG